MTRPPLGPRPLLAAALFSPLALAACAEVPPPQPAAAPEPVPHAAFQPGPREYSPIDQEMLAISRAEEDIDHAFPEARGPSVQRKGGRGAPVPDGKPADDKDTSYKNEPRAAGAMGGVATSGGDPCTVACKALSSMLASAEKLCHLSGENDGRCDDARARVRGASARVKSSCPGCTVSPPATAPASTPKGTPGPDKAPAPAPGMPSSAPGMPGSSSTIPLP